MVTDHHRGLHRPDEPQPIASDGAGPDGSLDVAAIDQSITLPNAIVSSPTPGFSPTYKGFNYVADVNGSYADANSLSQLPTEHANAAALTADYGIDAANNTVYSDDVDGGYTESDANVAATIGDAVTDGLSVMVRPLIDFLPSNYVTYPTDPPPNPKNASYSASEFRAYYNPGAAGSAGADSFFASYQTMIVNEARIAQANGAQLFCIGTELDQITGPSYENYWDTIIAAVQAVFTGKLTYSALWDDSLSPWQYGGSGLAAGTGNITTQISFWDKLAYVGIDEYAPISDKASPTLQDLVNGWEQVPTDQISLDVTGQQSLISYFEGVSTALQKPLLFTELGYANSTDAAINPPTPGYDQDGNADNATSDPTLQANLYTAFFDAWRQDGNSSLAGTYLWNWEPGGAGISDFSVQGLPAEAVVSQGYTACYAAGTHIATRAGPVAIERLHPGDLVLNAAGAQKPVIWVGCRNVLFAPVSDRSQPHPVRVRAHAFAHGQPYRDLVLSPDHAVFVDGMLLPIRRLVNDATVVRERVTKIVYWHVELAEHDVLLAEGLPAESYLDTGNRSSFANAIAAYGPPVIQCEPAQVWAARSCAPLVNDGPALHDIRARLDARANTLGFRLPATLDVRITRAGSMRVAVPGGTEQIRLLSATFRPEGDGRTLGALIAHMTLDGISIPFDDQSLIDGFHDVETHGIASVRWTDGAAILGFEPRNSRRILRIEIAMLAPEGQKPSDQEPAIGRRAAA